jgi:hypothetical protein
MNDKVWNSKVWQKSNTYQTVKVWLGKLWLEPNTPLNNENKMTTKVCSDASCDHCPALNRSVGSCFTARMLVSSGSNWGSKGTRQKQTQSASSLSNFRSSSGSNWGSKGTRQKQTQSASSLSNFRSQRVQNFRYMAYLLRSVPLQL